MEKTEIDIFFSWPVLFSDHCKRVCFYFHFLCVAPDKIYIADIHNLKHWIEQKIKKITQKKLKTLRTYFKINYVCEVR